MRTKSTRMAGSALSMALLLGLAACKSDTPEQLVAQAHQFEQKGDFAAAAIQLKNAVQLNPNLVESRIALGKLYLRIGEGASAEKELRRAVELGSKDDAVLVALCQSLIMQGKQEQVLELAKADSKNADVLATRGEAYLLLGKLNEAHEMLTEALRLQPANGTALYNMARYALTQRDRQGANRYLDDAIAQNARDVKALLLRGDLGKGAGANDEAMRDYNQVVAADPYSGAGQLQRAYLNISLQKYPEAKADLEALHKLAPKNILYYHAMGLWYFTQGQYAPAFDSVQKILKDAPDHLPSLLLGGAVLFAQGVYPQAESNLTRYLAAVPNDSYARKLLATIFVNTGRPKDALVQLAPMLGANVQDPNLLRIACRAYIDSGDGPRAVACYEKVVALEPEAATMQVALGLARMQVKDHKGALEAMRKAVEIGPKLAEPRMVLATTELSLGHFDVAQQELEALAKLHPENPLVHNLTGYAYSTQAKWPQARAAYEKALAVKPDYFVAVNNLVQIDVRENKPDAARGRYEEFLKKNPNSLLALNALADFARGENKPVEEQKWLERATAAAPANVTIALKLAQLQLRNNDRVKALTTARNLYTTHADDPQVLQLLGDVQMANGDAGGALESYAKLVAVQPKSAPALLKMAAAQEALKQTPQARQSLQSVLALEPDNRAAVSALVALEARDRKLERAVELTRNLQKRPGGELDGLLMEAELLLQAGHPEQATAAFDKVLAKTSSSALVMRAAKAYAGAGKNEEAVRRLQKWNSAHPADGATATYLGELYIADKKYQLAIAEFEKILKVKAGNPLVLNDLAVAYHLAGDPRALATAEQAYKAAPGDPIVQDTYGWLLAEQGQTARGLEILKQAATVQPDSTEIRYHLAVALSRLNQKAAARKELETLLAGNRSFPQAEEARNLLKQL